MPQGRETIDENHPGPTHRPPETAERDTARGDAVWQERLLPLMVRVVIGLALFFFLVSLLQLAYLQWHLQDEPPNILTTLDGEAVDASDAGLAAWLESDLITRRYRMTSALMMAQLWIRYLGFVTGMIMAFIGAVFILGKLREPPSEVKAESAAVRVSIATASPGILLAVVGSALMLATILTKQESEVRDAAIYLPGRPAAARSGTEMGDRLEEIRSRITAVEDDRESTRHEDGVNRDDEE